MTKADELTYVIYNLTWTLIHLDLIGATNAEKLDQHLYSTFFQDIWKDVM